MQLASLLCKPTCCMGSHSVTCHPSEVTIPPSPQQSWYSIERPRWDAKLSWPMNSSSSSTARDTDCRWSRLVRSIYRGQHQAAQLPWCERQAPHDAVLPTTSKQHATHVRLQARQVYTTMPWTENSMLTHARTHARTHAHTHTHAYTPVSLTALFPGLPRWAMPAPHCSVFYRPDALPAAQPTVSKHWRHDSMLTLS